MTSSPCSSPVCDFDRWSEIRPRPRDHGQAENDDQARNEEDRGGDQEIPRASDRLENHRSQPVEDERSHDDGANARNEDEERTSPPSWSSALTPSHRDAAPCPRGSPVARAAYESSRAALGLFGSPRGQRFRRNDAVTRLSPEVIQDAAFVCGERLVGHRSQPDVEDAGSSLLDLDDVSCSEVDEGRWNRLVRGTEVADEEVRNGRRLGTEVERPRSDGWLRRPAHDVDDRGGEEPCPPVARAATTSTASSPLRSRNPTTVPPLATAFRKPSRPGTRPGVWTRRHPRCPSPLSARASRKRLGRPHSSRTRAAR